MSYNLLAGKVGVIFGALNEQSIAWRVAERAIEEGAKIVLTNTAMAIRMGNLNELAAKIGATVVPADATSEEDLEQVFRVAMETFGRPVDFVLHSIGMSPNDCGSLTNVTIPSSVTSIDKFAFARCINLGSVVFKGNNPPKIPSFDSYVFNEIPSNLKLIIPKGAKNRYIKAGYPEDKIIEQ